MDQMIVSIAGHFTGYEIAGSIPVSSTNVLKQLPR
jgi:hypothetical protein